MMEAILESIKVDAPKERFDLLFTPVACVVSITTVDTANRVNFELVLGCQGANHVNLAVVRGEVVCRDLGLTAHFSREPFLSWHAKGLDRHLLQTG